MGMLGLATMGTFALAIAFGIAAVLDSTGYYSTVAVVFAAAGFILSSFWRRQKPSANEFKRKLDMQYSSGKITAEEYDRLMAENSQK